MTAVSIPGRFAEQAALAPGATAVSEAASGAELTYRELEQRANRLAHHLIGLGVGHEDRVPVGVDAVDRAKSNEAVRSASEIGWIP